eukprot:6186927-Pleurochrysis_carterae.AAC.2
MNLRSRCADHLTPTQNTPTAMTRLTACEKPDYIVRKVNYCTIHQSQPWHFRTNKNGDQDHSSARCRV